MSTKMQQHDADHDAADAGLTPSVEDRRRQRSRNLAIAWVLVAMAVMFFVVTIAKLGPGVLNRPL